MSWLSEAQQNLQQRQATIAPQISTQDSSFSTYVQNLLSQPRPQGNMFTGFTQDPFEKQNQIDLLAKEEADRLAAEEEAKKLAATAAATQAQQGMMTGGGSSNNTELNPYVAAFLDAETPAERDARLSSMGGLLGNIAKVATGNVGNLSSVNIASALGLDETTARAAQLAAQYAQTPEALRGLLPMTGAAYALTTPAGQANPQQTAALASQYESLGYSPETSAGLAIASQESAQSNPDGTYGDGGDYAD